MQPGPRVARRSRRGRAPARPGSRKSNSGYFPAAVIAGVLVLGIVVATVLMNSTTRSEINNSQAPAPQPAGAKQPSASLSQPVRQGGRIWNVRMVPQQSLRLRVDLDDPEPGIAQAAKEAHNADKKHFKGPSDPELQKVLREIVGFLKKAESRLEQHVAKNAADRPLMQRVRDLMSEESWYGVLMTLTDERVAEYFEQARGIG